MDPGEDRIIADAMYAALTNPGSYEKSRGADRCARRHRRDLGRDGPVSAGAGRAEFVIEQSGGGVTGLHHGELYSGKLQGRCTAT